MRTDILLMISTALAQAIYSNPPALTTDLKNQPDPWGWTPAPTTAPAAVELVKKQISDSHSFCGYLDGIQCMVISCEIEFHSSFALILF